MLPSTSPCDGKLVHPKNGLVMLPDPAYCLQHSGLITTITTPELLDTAFNIPSIPAVTPKEESWNLMLHKIRSALKDVPTLDVTLELVNEMVDKIHLRKTTSNPFAMGQHCIHLKSRLVCLVSLYGVLHLSFWLSGKRRSGTSPKTLQNIFTI